MSGGNGTDTDKTHRNPLKVLLLGNEGCGKTSLLRTYTGKTFDEEYNPSVFDYYTATVTLENKNSQDLTLWDTSGSTDFDHVRPLSYKDTDVILLCFDVTNDASLDSISQKWMLEMFENVPGKPFLLVGCKSDLRNSSPGTPQKNGDEQVSPVTHPQAIKFAKTIKAADYMECSSKQMNDEIDRIFSAAARLGLGLNRRYSWKKKKTTSIDVETSDKSKCTIS